MRIYLNKKNKILQKIYFNTNKTSANKVELFDQRGGLLYRAKFVDMQRIKGFRVPKRIDITDENGSGFSIHISKYMANIPVSESAFILKQPPKI